MGHDVDCESVHPVLRVSDVRAAADFYAAKLGFKVAFLWGDPPRFAGVNLGKIQLFLQEGTVLPGSSAYFVVDDADALCDFHTGRGVEIVQAPADQPYELRDFRVRDLDGNELSFGHHLLGAGEPVIIERVDVPVRLEKRLAALLTDLAAHKRMSVASCLEETLLHTFEPLGDGVASPHTPRTLRTIGELKRKHGIDYDAQTSYRFREA